MSLQIVAQSMLIQTIRWTLQPSDMSHTWEILSSNLSSSRTYWSQYTSRGILDHIQHPFSEQISTVSGSVGCFTTSYARRTLLDSLTTACSACTSHRASAVRTNKTSWMASGPEWSVIHLFDRIAFTLL